MSAAVASTRPTASRGPTASRDVMRTDSVYAPLSTNTRASGPAARLAPAAPAHHRYPSICRGCRAKNYSGSEEVPGKRGTWHPACPWHHASDSPGREPALVILEIASLLNRPPHLRRQPVSSKISPAFIWAGVGQPGGVRSAWRCQLAQPAAPWAVPAAGVVGTHQKSLEKHENKNCAPSPIPSRGWR